MSSKGEDHSNPVVNRISGGAFLLWFLTGLYLSFVI